MPEKLRVEFSELALAGLAKAMLDTDKRKSIEYAIRFFLKDPQAIFRSRRCPAFADLDLYIWPIQEVRVLFEVTDFAMVWSVYAAAKSDSEIG